MNLASLTRRINVEIATWPQSLRQAGGFYDSGLTEAERREAAAILRARAVELEPFDPTTAPCPACVGKREHSAEEAAQWHPQGLGARKEHGA